MMEIAKEHFELLDQLAMASVTKLQQITDMQAALQQMQAEQHTLLEKIIELESDNAQLRAWLERVEPDRPAEPEVFPVNALRHSR